MKIRKAVIEDASEIKAIAESLRLNQNRPQGGFLVYPLAEEGYQKRIRSSSYFYVAEEDARLQGFLMCYDDATIRRLSETGELSHQDGVLKYLQSQPAPFIFGDQIGIQREKLRSGVGNLLMEGLIADMKTNGVPTMYVGILLHPTRNVASIKFCERLGFKQVAEVENKDHLAWGIYQADFS